MVNSGGSRSGRGWCCSACVLGIKQGLFIGELCLATVSEWNSAVNLNAFRFLKFF